VSSPDSTRPTFLVVDDHVPFRKALARALQDYGEVTHAGTAAEGKSLATKDDWAALFIDVTLPDGSGLDVLAYARARGCTAPALVLTASHDPATINRAFDCGARVLIKPGEWNLIESFVQAALASRARVRDVAVAWANAYGLSPTETEILIATAEGSTREQVIDERDIAVATFKRHVVNLLGKTKDPSLAHAAARLLREVGGIGSK